MSIQDEPQRTATEVDDDMAAWEAGLARIEADLRARHPEFFDESGKLIPGKVSQLLRERSGGKTELTKSEFLAIVGGTRPRRSDAT